MINQDATHMIVLDFVKSFPTQQTRVKLEENNLKNKKLYKWLLNYIDFEKENKSMPYCAIHLLEKQSIIIGEKIP